MQSRVFSVYIDDLCTSVMVPLADMINHNDPHHASWDFDDSRQLFCFTAVNEIKRGQEMTISYGDKWNVLFLMNYGFIPQPNPHNAYLMTVKIDP